MSVHVRGLAEGLRGLGDEVIVIPKGEAGGPSAGLSYLRRMSRGFDVIHVQGLQYFEPLTAALVTRWVNGAVPVATAHGFGGESRWWKHGTQRQLMRQTVRRFNGVIAISEYVKRRLQSFAGLPPSRVFTVYNGVDTRLFDPEIDGVNFRRRHGLEGKFVILYVGRLARNKGLPNLVNSMPDVLRRIPNAKLVVCGRGKMEPLLRAEVQSSNLGSNVEFVGPLPGPDLPACYASCDLFVLPSTLEPFGLVLLEAMSMRKPVIGTKVGGIPEVIAHGENGMLVPPNDPGALSEAIQKLAADDSLRSRLATNGRKTVESSFTLERMARDTQRCYVKVTS
jgi:glycosyltransferase involved in cell wall biosynthesis